MELEAGLKVMPGNLYRSLVGSGIYLSQERPDVSYTIKELASTMSCPTTGSLRKLGKHIGYLKGALGQYGVLEMSEPGQDLVGRTQEARWLLETFSDSDIGRESSSIYLCSYPHAEWSCDLHQLTRAKERVTIFSSR